MENLRVCRWVIVSFTPETDENLWMFAIVPGIFSSAGFKAVRMLAPI